MIDHVVVHYAEIGIKGKNRSAFEKLLMDNIRTKAGKLITSIIRESGHLTIEMPEGSDISKLQDILGRTPGIAFSNIGKRCSLVLGTLQKEVLDFLKDEQFETFKVDTRRHNKNFELNSMELNSLLGEEIVKAYHKKAKMTDPDLTLMVEISNKDAYISAKRIDGVGGFPVDPRQKVIALMSGGFDSPIASYLMMKRGCEVILVHFWNKSQMATSVEGKIVELAKHLSHYQLKTKLYLIPFEPIQKQIIMKVKAEMRMLVYRKFMMEIAAKIAEKEGANFLVMGDSISQVASQTLENLSAVYEGSAVLSPLIGMDKQEIIDISRKIGTFETSKLPYGDCCTYFVPRHPELRADANLIEKNMSKFDVEALAESAMKKAKLKEW